MNKTREDKEWAKAVAKLAWMAGLSMPSMAMLPEKGAKMVLGFARSAK